MYPVCWEKQDAILDANAAYFKHKRVTCDVYQNWLLLLGLVPGLERLLR